MKKKYKIYMLLNNKNGKIYIGQTCRTLKARFGCKGNGYLHPKKINRIGQAILKYGWDSFSSIILEEVNTPQIADLKERFYISLYHSNTEAFGYNIINGGVYGCSIPKEIRDKIANSLKGKVSWTKGRHHSEETKRKISMVKKGVSHPNTTIWTEEMRKHQSEIMKGKKMPQSAIEKLKQYKGEKAIWYGKHHSEETKRKLREYKGEKASWYGRKHTEEYKAYMSKKVSGKNNQAYGKHWFTNGEINIFTYDCPPGFKKGVTKKNKKEELKCCNEKMEKTSDIIISNYRCEEKKVCLTLKAT